MQPIPDALKHAVDARDTSKTTRTDQSEQFALLVAASEAGGDCPAWFADRLADGDWGRA